VKGGAHDHPLTNGSTREHGGMPTGLKLSEQCAHRPRRLIAKTANNKLQVRKGLGPARWRCMATVVASHAKFGITCHASSSCCHALGVARPGRGKRQHVRGARMSLGFRTMFALRHRPAADVPVLARSSSSGGRHTDVSRPSSQTTASDHLSTS